MVSQRARDRSKRKKAEVASRLTRHSNAEIICALAYCMRHFKPGGWVPFEAVSAHWKTLDRKKRDAMKCARWMLKLHANKTKGFYMLRYPDTALERFGLRWVDWSELDPCVSRTILAFELQHPDLWRLVKSFLLGEDFSPLDLLTKETFNPTALAEIRDQLNVAADSFVAGVQAAAQPAVAPKTVVREVDGQRIKMQVKEPAVAEKQILGVGPRYLNGREQW